MGTIRLAVLLIALALSGCAGQPPWSLIASRQDTEPPATRIVSRAAPVVRRAATEPADSYKLDAGDRVRVVVAGNDALSGSYDVGNDGAIEIPSLGTVAARGLSTAQLSTAIARQLKQRDRRDAHVAVQVETYRPFTIRGEVANPGQYPYVNNMTAETAIAIAGGLKAGAEKSAISVGRNTVPARAASPDTPVRPGDTVTVTQER